MTTDTSTEKTTEQLRQEFIDSLGLEYSAQFVPFSQSRNSEEKNPSVNWVITLTRGRTSLKTDYMQGIAHIPGYKQMWGRVPLEVEDEQRQRVEYGTEKGKTFSGLASWGGPTGLKPLPAPSIKDVLYSLVMDASVLDYSEYEDWARDLGYDPDSRSGEKVYRACLKNTLTLRAMIGDANLQTLRELFQDY